MNKPDVFISFSGENYNSARQLVETLESVGLRVWWDRLLKPEDNFRERIPEILNCARSVIVLWSQQACISPYVKFEAETASKRGDGLLLHVLLEPGIQLQMPFSANSIKGSIFDFSNWQGNPCDACFVDLLNYLQQFAPVLKKLMELDQSFNARVKNLNEDEFECLRVLDTQHFSSFNPNGDGEHVFYRLQFRSSKTWIPEELYNALPSKETPINGSAPKTLEMSGQRYINALSRIFVVRDPIRPFETQIGETRSLRPDAQVGTIEGNLDKDFLNGWYMQIAREEFRWLRMAIADILTNPEALDYIANKEEEDKDIRCLASKNPYASKQTQHQACRFCSKDFQARSGSRVLEDGAFIFPNDYPFGPYFHYVVAVTEQVHAWNEMNFDHYFAMNRLIHSYLTENNGAKLNGAKGVQIGLNSSTRHLVLGRRTHSSAGASVAHVHKQLWGMAPHSINLAQQLIEICDAYNVNKIDYLARYLKALDDMGLVIWKNDHVALFVPFGQTSLHELQAMVIDRKSTFLDLNKIELKSLSKAEFIATRLFAAWGINSFNEVIISKSFDEPRGESFRLIMTFITREVDIAVSELSLLYVVNKHPVDTMRKFITLMNTDSSEALGVKEAIDYPIEEDTEKCV